MIASPTRVDFEVAAIVTLVALVAAGLIFGTLVGLTLMVGGL